MNSRLKLTEAQPIVTEMDDVTRRMHMDFVQLAKLGQLRPGLEWMDPTDWETAAQGNASAEQFVRDIVRSIAERFKLTQANLDWRARHA